MKKATLALVSLVLLSFLPGCKGFWDARVNPPDGGGGNATSSGDFYVLNSATSQIAGYYVKSGTLTSLPGSPYALAAAPIAIAIAPNNQFLYVSTVQGIFLYSVNTSTGQLTLANNGQAISQDPASSMAVDSTNSWLVEGFSGTATAFAIHVNSSTGVLASSTEQTVALTASTVQQVAISPDNSMVLVAMGAGGTAVIPFNSGASNPFGSITTIHVKNVAGAALSVAFDPIITGTSPELFYIGETAALSPPNSGGLRVFSFSTLQELSGSPLATDGLAPYSILPFSDGKFLYVLSRQTSAGSAGVIKGYSITTSGSALTLTALGSNFATGTNPQSMAEDSTHTFVFVTNFGGSPDLIGYNIDATNAGYLDKVVSASTGIDPVSAIGVGTLH